MLKGGERSLRDIVAGLGLNFETVRQIVNAHRLAQAASMIPGAEAVAEQARQNHNWANALYTKVVPEELRIELGMAAIEMGITRDAELRQTLKEAAKTIQGVNVEQLRSAYERLNSKQ